MEIAEETKIEVDCGTCAVRSPRTCAGCLVTHICDRSDDRAVVITIDELRSMRLFNEAGMLPELRHAPRRAS